MDYETQSYQDSEKIVVIEYETVSSSLNGKIKNPTWPTIPVIACRAWLEVQRHLPTKR